MEWGSIALLIFSGFFMIFGIYRVVEFSDVGLSPTQRRLLICLHLMGSALFSCAMALMALDPLQERKQMLHLLFGLGMLTLFPVHIFVALKRRIRIREHMERRQQMKR